MKILVISNFYPPVRSYGYAQWCQEVTEALRARDHDVKVLTSRHDAESIVEQSVDVRRELYLQTPSLYHYSLLHFFVHRGREHRANRFFVRRALEDIRPDVVFVWGMWSLSHDVPCEAERFANVPVAYFVSDVWPARPDTHTGYWSLPTRRRLFSLLKAGLRRLALRRLRRSGWPYRPRFEHVICVSEFIRDSLSLADLPFENAIVVHGGTDPERFRETNAHPAAPNGPHVRVLYAGLFADHKGIHVILEAVGALLKDRPELNWRLRLVGDGLPEYVAGLNDQVERLALLHHVAFEAPRTREEMPALLAQNDVLIFSSTGPEAFPRMLQEAMLSGMAVIGTVSGGTGEILVHDENGLVYDAESPEALGAALARIIADDALRQRLAANGRRTVDERFTLTAMVDAIEAHLVDWATQADSHENMPAPRALAELA